MEGAHGVLLSIAGGSDLGLFEINEAASLVQESAHPDANIIFGTVIDDSLGDEVRITVIAAGFDSGMPSHKRLDPKKLEAAITSKTKAIIPVSLYGQCADFDAINAIAAKHNIPVIEDAAQSFGASYKGKKSCNLSTVATTSFFPSKPLGCYGDGGAIFTNDDELAIVLRQIARHGQDRRYHHIRVGVNSRLDTLQAAILLPKLEIFAEEITLRQEVAATYD